MFSLLSRSEPSTDLLSSKLYSEETFYKAFIKDLKTSMHEVIIESPFITSRRLNQLLPVLKQLKERRVRIVVNTRDPNEKDCGYMCDDTFRAIAELQYLGVHVVYTKSHHRKLVIIDRQILYEGSLNILSQNNSREIMRRIVSTELAWQMAKFISIDKYLS